MIDPVDTDALRTFGQAMQVEIPEHLYLADQVMSAADEVDRLRAVIENAPHNRTCPASVWNDWMLDVPRPCTCWKANAL